MTRKHRRFFRIDRSMRWPVGITIGSVLAIGVVLVTARRRLIGSDEPLMLADLDGGKVSMICNALYFVATLALVVWYAISISHRFAGPARVLEHALDGMLVDDFERRVTLRRKDHLKGVAERIGKVAQRMRVEQEAQRAFLRELADHLAREDYDGARHLVDAARGGAAGAKPSDASPRDELRAACASPR
jgi:hypothetical protein